MKSLHLLSLLHILSTSPINSVATTLNTTIDDATCHYDPFYRMRPIILPDTCSLSVKSSTDLTPELMSFEEWKKAREVAMESATKPRVEAENASQRLSGDAEDGLGADRDNAANAEGGTAQHLGAKSGDIVEDSNNARFWVPLTDRFNYASQDCTARIHSAHKGAKSPGAVLSGKKDRYMLSPCASKSKFVVVELCDDVRIDTVQLANYEFFSGVFKDIRISLSETAPGDATSWTDAGTYRAKNRRGVQSFHPPEGRRKFWRYIRIEFLSHYGNEFYCPVSLLRVYGLTPMEDYKWVGWQADNQPTGVSTASEMAMFVTEMSSADSLPPSSSSSAIEEQTTSSSSTTALAMDISRSSDGAPTMPTTVPASEGRPSPLMTAEPQETIPVSEANALPDTSTASQPSLLISVDVDATPSNSSSAKPGDAPPITTPTTQTHSTDPVSISSSPYLPANGSTDASTAPSKEQPTNRITSSASPITTQSPSANSNGGVENIYRTIMNRLHMLETNSTLGMRYVEEQARFVREVVRRLEEDLGRLDALTKEQDRALKKVILDMAEERRYSNHEFNRLSQQIQDLTREVSIEKRMGFMQLLLLVVLFFLMIMTRGTPDSSFLAAARSRSMRKLQGFRGGEWRWPQRSSEDLRRKPPKLLFNNAKGHPIDDPFREEHVPRSLVSPIQATFRASRNSRQRVISSPSLPTKLRHTSPRRPVFPHLHELKPEHSRRRNIIDLAEDDDGGDTPRTLRTIPFGGFQHGEAEKGKRRYERGDRATSVGSTVADDSSGDSAAWEDTSTEGSDDPPEETYPAETKSSSPSVKSDGDPDLLSLLSSPMTYVPPVHTS